MAVQSLLSPAIAVTETAGVAVMSQSRPRFKISTDF